MALTGPSAYLPEEKPSWEFRMEEEIRASLPLSCTDELNFTLAKRLWRD
jgi:hypothetical protein